MTTITVDGLGEVEIAGDEPSERERAAISQALEGTRQRRMKGEKVAPVLEHPDAPTTAALPTATGVGLKDFGSPWNVLKNLPEAAKDLWDKSGSMLAASLGPLSTSNPRARQEILAKHYPKAKPIFDKYGNPMIEHDGKKFYNTRYGEIDALDVARTAAGLVGSAPFMLAAPASVPGAIIGAGLFAGGQSLAEDVVTQAAGGESQEIDFKKAGLAALTGGGMAGASSAVVPLARLAYSRFAGEMFDAAGQPTMRGARILQDAGFSAEQIKHLTPELRQEISQTVGRNFGSPQAAGTAYRRGLGDEFGIPQTEGALTHDPAQLGLEKRLRGGSRGPEPQAIFNEQHADSQTMFNQAQELLRRNAGGGRLFTKGEAGDAVVGAHHAADDAAAANVTSRYNQAGDPAAVTAAGGTPRLRVDDFKGLTQRVAQSLDAQGGPGAMIVDDTVGNLAPNARAMMAQIRAFERGDVGGPQGTVALGWDAVDKLRRQLDVSRRGAVASNNATDINAVRRILDAFDDHIGAQNPLIAQARAAHAERARTFWPNDRQTPLTQTMLKLLDKQPTAIPGEEVFNKLFSDKLLKGEGAEAVSHLLKIHPPGSPGHKAMGEHALQRLFVNPNTAAGTNPVLSPARIATNIDKALSESQIEVYRQLLPPELFSKLHRIRDLASNIESSARNINASGSGHLAVAEAREAGSKALGAAIMGFITESMGKPVQVLSALGGRAAGKAMSNSYNRGLAARAISPSRTAGDIPAGPIGYRGGMLLDPLVEDESVDSLLGR